MREAKLLSEVKGKEMEVERGLGGGQSHRDGKWQNQNSIPCLPGIKIQVLKHSVMNCIVFDRKGMI